MSAAADHSHGHDDRSPVRPGTALERGFLGLGSNVGDRRAQLQWAVDQLPQFGVRVVRSSSTYDTDPVGEVLDQPSFLNACVEIETALGPIELLDACKAIERQRGRVLAGQPGYVKDGPRAIDIDVLLLGERTLRHERLTLPHPQATSRRFVLIPLLELDRTLTTPAGDVLSDALAQLPFDEGVRRDGPPLRVVPAAPAARVARAAPAPPAGG